MLMMAVLLFCLLSTVINVRRIIPEGSCPLCKMTNDKFLSAIIAIPPSFEVEFHGRLDSEVQKFIFCFCQAWCIICENLSLTWGLEWTFFSVRKIKSIPFSFRVL